MTTTRTRSETMTGKARLLALGAVTVAACDEHSAVAFVQGDHDAYQVQYHHGAWSCSCPAWGECSHVLAVRLCTTVTPTSRGGDD